MKRNWPKMLLAVLGGNLVYLALRPYLPGFLAHTVFRIDGGLVLDMALCAIIYILIRKLL